MLPQHRHEVELEIKPGTGGLLSPRFVPTLKRSDSNSSLHVDSSRGKSKLDKSL